MKRMALVVLTATLWASGISGSEEASPQSIPAGSHFKIAMISNDKSSLDEKGVFAPDAPRVFTVYRVVVAGSGSRVKAVWIAEKVEGLEAKSKIAENESTFPSKGEYIGSLSCSRPPQGWWIGRYVVNLYMDGVLKKTLGFRVEKP